MNFIDSIRAMPLGRQILLAAGALVIAAFVLGSVYFVFLRQPDSVLFSNLRPLDAATIVAELDKRKLPYHLKDGGTTILVAANQVDATRLSILSEDLPLKGTVGFELFNKSDIGLTEFEQRINYQRALQGELSRTIMALDEVDTARVHLSLPEPTIFRDDRRAPKASIALTLKPGRRLSASDVAGIQRLVAAAVSDLDAVNVVVVDGEGQMISPDAASEAAVSESPNQHAAETFYASKIRRALAETYPGQDFTVRVAATPIEDGSGATDSGDKPADPFAGWTPGQRNFSLTVDIVTPAASDAEAQKNIRVAAANAIMDDPALGDDVSVLPPNPAPPAVSGDVAPDAVAQVTVASAQPVPTAVSTSKLPGYMFWIAAILVALLGLVLYGGRLLRPNRTVRRLTEAERQDFASRFQVLLEQGERDAIDG